MAYFFRGQAETNFEELQVNPVVMSEERKRQEIAIPVNQPPAAIQFTEEKVSLFQRVRIAVGGGDIIFTLMRNGVPTLTLNASFTVAKTFGESIRGDLTNSSRQPRTIELLSMPVVVNFQAKANAPSESS